MGTSRTEGIMCKECAEGKHANCVGWAFDGEVEVDCQCEKCV